MAGATEKQHLSGLPWGFRPYFDDDSYSGVNEDSMLTRAGPRARLFWQGYDREKPPPYLINVPLIRWEKDLNYKAGTYFISNVKVASIVGVKQHFKFFSDFYTYAEAEAARKEHWNNVSEYVAYWDVLSSNPQLSARYHGSVRYVDSMQLVDLGSMRLPDDYRGFLDQGRPGA